MTEPAPEDRYEFILGNAVEIMSTLAAETIDAIICDPPYPEVDREYGRMSEVEWLDMMRAVIAEGRRILSPTGSMMFVLQPNSEHHGRMRPWLWRFLAELSGGNFDWGIVQDAYWWNWAAMPLAGTQRDIGLLRGSLKYCVWYGRPDCYRDQSAVLWEASESVKVLTREKRAFAKYDAPDGKTIDKNKIMATSEQRGGVTPFNVIPLASEELNYKPFGAHTNLSRMLATSEQRGGVTPFNVIPLANTDSGSSGGAWGHPAATPAKLMNWWIRYLTRAGQVVLDPFSGSGTTVIEAVKLGRCAVGVDSYEKYHQMTICRAAEALADVR